MTNNNLVVAISCIVFTVIAFMGSRGLSFEGGFFLNSALIFLAVLSVVLLIESLIKKTKIVVFESKNEVVQLIVIMAIISGFLFFLPRAGFLLSGYIAYFAFSYYIEQEKKPIQLAIIAFCGISVLFIVFKYLLAVPLPMGTWFE